jgi:hypothetical protein
LDPSVYAAAVAAATASASTHAEALGIDPASAVRTLVKDVAIRLRNVNDEQLVQSAAGGMRLSAGLATRTFELTVHTLDIAAVTGITATSTPKAPADAACLAARIAATVGNRRARSPRADRPRHPAQGLLRPVGNRKTTLSVEPSASGTARSQSETPRLKPARSPDHPETAACDIVSATALIHGSRGCPSKTLDHRTL